MDQTDLRLKGLLLELSNFLSEAIQNEADRCNSVLEPLNLTIHRSGPDLYIAFLLRWQAKFACQLSQRISFVLFGSPVVAKLS